MRWREAARGRARRSRRARAAAAAAVALLFAAGACGQARIPGDAGYGSPAVAPADAGSR